MTIVYEGNMSAEELHQADGEMWTCVDTGCGEPRSVPCARGKHSATLLAGHVYVLGGRGAGGALPLRDFWRYSLDTGKWERLENRGDPPPALQEHTATAHENKLYVFGGEAGSSNETPLWIYDTKLEVWRKVAGRAVSGAGAGRGAGGRRAGAPGGRRGHSAHALHDCLLVYGGYMDLRGSTSELWAFHYETERWRAVTAASAGPARHRHAAALLGSRLYVHGGQCDLRVCADLWHYDIVSRAWSEVRGAGGAGPGARCGHAALRAGAHLYVFGGEARGHAASDLWRWHFATETWERINQTIKWPSARVDCRVLLVGGATVRAAAGPVPEDEGGGCGGEGGGGGGGGGVWGGGRGGGGGGGGGLLRELSRLSALRVRRGVRCAYTALGARDSAESLLCKSRSAHALAERRAELSREPLSVPDFGDVAPLAPDAKLVYLDSEDEEDLKISRNGADATVLALPKSASVRFSRRTAAEDEAELSTSDYASAEGVHRLAGAAGGFSNPHYQGADSAATPDSGVCGADVELRELRPRAARSLHLLLVGGREPPREPLFQSPLSMWTYRLL